MNKTAIMLAAVWLGMQITAGYIAAPILFRELPRVQAGAIAGELFGFVSYGGILIWLLLYLVGRLGEKRRSRPPYTGKLVLLQVLLLTANQYLFTPVIDALKTRQGNWLLNLAGGTFGMWHGISATVYLATALLGGWLVWRLIRLEWR